MKRLAALLALLSCLAYADTPPPIYNFNSPLTKSGINIGCQSASGSQAGCLSSTDWSTFNGKQSSLSFSSPLVNTGGMVSCSVATGSVAGCLSSSDWTTFNGKQSTISFAAVGSSPSANGASISSGVITLQPEDATHPGLLTNGSQTISGAKTFSTAPNFSSLSASQAMVTDSSKNAASMLYTSSNNGSSIASRDSNGNSTFNRVDGTSTTIVSSGQTVSMNAGSGQIQKVTGSSTVTFKLPDATTLINGSRFQFNNNSTGVVTIQNNGAGAITTMQSGSFLEVTCTDNSTTNGGWDVHWYMPSSAVYGNAGLSVTGTLSATSTVNFSGLSASQAVVTDSSSNLASLGYASANTTSTLVERDSSGNFTAGTITAALTGTASNATNVATTATNSTNSTFYPTFVGSSSSSNQGIDTATGLTFNPSTNTLSTTTFSGALSGNATNITASSNTSLTSLSNLATVGTVTSGTWNGTAVAPTYGGTGIDTHASTGYPSVSSGTWSVASVANTFITLFETVATSAGDLIYGGASGTPTRLAKGLEGQLLTENSSQNPVWEDPYGDNQIITLVDEFTGDTVSTFSVGDTNFVTNKGAGTGTAFSTSVSDQNHPGIVRMDTGTTATNAQIAIRKSPSTFLPGAASFQWEAIVRFPNLSTSTEEYNAIIGLLRSSLGSAATDTDAGFYFRYYRPQTFTCSSTSTNSSASITNLGSCTTVLDTSSIQTGMAVTDSKGCFQANTTVSVAPVGAGSTLTLNQVTNGSGCGASDTLTFTVGNYLMYEASTSSSHSIQVTSTAITAGGWLRFGMTMNAADTSVSAQVAGVTQTNAITTNLPTTSQTIFPYLGIVKTATAGGSGQQLDVDRWWHKIVLNSAR